jgi:hypothetical protein
MRVLFTLTLRLPVPLALSCELPGDARRAQHAQLERVSLARVHLEQVHTPAHNRCRTLYFDDFVSFLAGLVDSCLQTPLGCPRLCASAVPPLLLPRCSDPRGVRLRHRFHAAACHPRVGTPPPLAPPQRGLLPQDPHRRTLPPLVEFHPRAQHARDPDLCAR